MLDWIKYFPLALSRSAEKTSIQGPYFKRFHSEEWRIADSKFYCELPKSQSIYGNEQYGAPSENKSPAYKKLNTLPLSTADQESMPNSRWQVAWFFARKWYFIGPWFSGQKSNLRMSSVVLSPSNSNNYEGASLFHPRVFESSIADYLNSFYGHWCSGSRPHYQGPLNWQRVSLSPELQGASLDIQKNEGSGYERVFLFPISHTRLVSINFDFGGRTIDHPYMPTMMKLTESIIKTFRFEMGPDTKAEWNKVSQQCPDMSLTETFGELQWPIKPEDVGKPQVSVETEPPKIGM